RAAAVRLRRAGGCRAGLWAADLAGGVFHRTPAARPRLAQHLCASAADPAPDVWRGHWLALCRGETAALRVDGLTRWRGGWALACRATRAVERPPIAGNAPAEL